MKRWGVRALKLVASFPLALILGTFAAHILETGLWPLLFFPESWLRIIDAATTIVCQISLLGFLIWYWALERQ